MDAPGTPATCTRWRAGALSADHGSPTAQTIRLDRSDAAALFDELRGGDLSRASVFEAHMLYVMAAMSVRDGLVMTVHPGIHRNHHRPTFAAFGPDTGHDIPVRTDFTAGLAPLLAGFYPSVFLGAPWWFLDAPDAIRRFREAVTETAGFSQSSGLIDDTRGYCSIPVRHDTARRVEMSVLARLVVERRVSEERAAEIIVDLIDGAPRRVFQL